ncbi:5337_t:CDS:2, partial [Funneliformis caledonium]
MPRLTKLKKNLREARKAKAMNQYIKNNVNDVNDIFVYDDSDSDNVDLSDPDVNDASFDNKLEGYEDVDNFSVCDKLVENDKAASIETQVVPKEERISNSNAEKSTTEINVEVEHNTDEQTDDEIE